MSLIHVVDQWESLLPHKGEDNVWINFGGVFKWFFFRGVAGGDVVTNGYWCDCSLRFDLEVHVC